MKKIILIAMIILLCMFAMLSFSLAQPPENSGSEVAQLPEERDIEIEIGKDEADPGRAVIEDGIQHYNKKQYAEAIAEYEKAISQFPGTDYAAEAQFRIGNVYHWGTREPNKALDAYQKVMDNYPESEFAVECLVRIGSVYHWEFDKPDPQKAVEYYQRMLTKAPDNAYASEALFWMGETYNWMLKDKDKAIEIYKELVDDYPQSDYIIRAQLRMAGIYRYKSTGKWEDYWSDTRAKEIYENIAASLLEGPYVEEARYYLGLFYLHQEGDRESALREFKAALNYSTYNVECLYWAGRKIAGMYSCSTCPQAFIEENEKELNEFMRVHAARFTESCQRIMIEQAGTRNSALAQYYLGRFYFDENEYDKALEALPKVLSMIPKYDRVYYDAQFYIAWCYAMKRQYEYAVSEYEKMLEYSNDKPAILLNISLTYEEASDFADARIQYKEIVELYPGTIYADEATKRLKIMERLRY